VFNFSAIPTSAALFGTRADESLLRELGRNSDYFGSDIDPYRGAYQSYMDNIVIPLRKASDEVVRIRLTASRPDEIFLMNHHEDLRYVTPSMMGPLITYSPLYTLLRQGRIDGWGYLPNEDLAQQKTMYDRLIRSNGHWHMDEPDKFETDTVKDVRKRAASFFEEDPDDMIITVEEIHTDDIVEYTLPQSRLLRIAQSQVAERLRLTNFDPTDNDNLRG